MSPAPGLDPWWFGLLGSLTMLAYVAAGGGGGGGRAVRERLTRLTVVYESGAVRSGSDLRGLHLVGAAAFAFVATIVVAPRLLVGVCFGAVLAVIGWRLRRQARHRAERRARQRATIEFCDALAAELRAGLSATDALAHAGGCAPVFAAVGRAAQLGDDVAAAMRRISQNDGAEGLQFVAACWDVASVSGAALAGLVDGVGEALRAEDDARAELTAALAPPRATARMLAVLPAFGLLLGTATGADPVGFLFGDPIGIACLATGSALAGIGVIWVEALARAVES